MKKRIPKEVHNAILNLAYEIEKVLVEKPPTEIPSSDELLKTIASCFENVRFAHRRGIRTSIVHEASVLSLFLALYIHKVKNGN